MIKQCLTTESRLLRLSGNKLVPDARLVADPERQVYVSEDVRRSVHATGRFRMGR